MSFVHGVASAIIPGSGQIIGGKGKEGLKYMGKNVATNCACLGATAGAIGIAAGSGVFGAEAKDFFVDMVKTATKNKPKVLDALKKFAKNKTAVKAAGIAACTVAGLSFILNTVNWVKSIVSASNIKADK